MRFLYVLNLQNDCCMTVVEKVCPVGGALRVKISRGAPLEVQDGTQQDLNKMIDLVKLGGKKIVYMLKMGGFEMGPNKI